MEFYFMPEWARFIVMDLNGIWYAHQTEPKYNKTIQAWESSGLRERLYIKAETTCKEIEPNRFTNKFI